MALAPHTGMDSFKHWMFFYERYLWEPGLPVQLHLSIYLICFFSSCSHSALCLSVSAS